MGLAFTAVERLKKFCCKSRSNGLAYEGDPTERPEALEAQGGFLEIFGGCDERQKEFFEALLDQQLRTADLNKENFLDGVKVSRSPGGFGEFERGYCVGDGAVIGESAYGVVKWVTEKGGADGKMAVKIVYKDLASPDQLWQVSNELGA
jgi:hypothetical protein